MSLGWLIGWVSGRGNTPGSAFLFGLVISAMFAEVPCEVLGGVLFSVSVGGRVGGGLLSAVGYSIRCGNMCGLLVEVIDELVRRCILSLLTSSGGSWWVGVLWPPCGGYSFRC